jgi:hypothetical protein
MTLLKRKNTRQKQVVDLSGPQGNAYFLLASASRMGRQLGMTAEEVEVMMADMRSSDYKHLVETFDNHFGTFVDLILPEKGL